MEMYLIIWLAVAAIILVGGTFLAGFRDDKDFDSFDQVSGCFVLAVAWPVFLVIVLCLAPFYGIFLLGRKVKQISQ